MFKKLITALKNLLKPLIETIIAWCLGFLLASALFAALIFYVIPFFFGIPLDKDKYITQTSMRIAENKKRIIVAIEEEIPEPIVIEETRPLSDTIIESIDKAADNLIRWINEPEQ